MINTFPPPPSSLLVSSFRQLSPVLSIRSPFNIFPFFPAASHSSHFRCSISSRSAINLFPFLYPVFLFPPAFLASSRRLCFCFSNCASFARRRLVYLQKRELYVRILLQAGGNNSSGCNFRLIIRIIFRKFFPSAKRVIV